MGDAATSRLTGFPFDPIVLFVGRPTLLRFPTMATIPTIHLNGTGFTTLRDEYAAAYDAIDKAMDALAAATLNGRDYYPQPDGAYYKARAERDEALDKLRDASLYVGEMLAGICDQRR